MSFGGSPYSRSIGPSDQSKIKQMPIQESFAIDVGTQAEQIAALTNKPGLTQMTREHPSYGPLGLRAGEPAFRVRGQVDGGVLCALNGLDARFFEFYPNDPEMVRLCVRQLVQFVGIVTQDARNDLRQPRVTLQIGGTVTQYAPDMFNVPGYADSDIQLGDMVIYDVPNLKNPIVGGGAQDVGKLVLVPRAATKESITTSLLHELSHIVHDPDTYQKAHEFMPHVANHKMATATAIKNAAVINGLMMLDLLLKEGVVQIADGFKATINGNTSSAQVAQIAEGLSLLHPGDNSIMQPGEFAGSLSFEQTQKWKQIEFDLNQRLFPLPNPDTGKYNARTEYGMRFDENTRRFQSQARSVATGEILRTPEGALLTQSLTAQSRAIASIVMSSDEEKRNCGGFAASSANSAGTNQFTLLIHPQGGLHQTTV